jgi:uncharacterized protein with PQ loop repeat
MVFIVIYLIYAILTMIFVAESLRTSQSIKVWHVPIIMTNILLIIGTFIILIIEVFFYANRNYIPQKFKDFLNKEIYRGDV